MNSTIDEMILFSIINGLVGSLMDVKFNTNQLTLSAEKALTPSPIDDHLCYGCQV